jgi:hypothetical protein
MDQRNLANHKMKLFGFFSSNTWASTQLKNKKIGVGL